jgi:hypothetical protein
VRGGGNVKLNAIVERWRSVHAGRAVERDRFGAAVLVEMMRFQRRHAVYSSMADAADAIIRNAIAWEPTEQKLGAGPR